MSIAEYFRVLRKRWVTIAVLTALGAALGVALTLTAEPQYRAQSESFVTIAGTSGGAGSILQGSQFTIQRVSSYTQLVDSPFVLQPVIDELALDETVSELAQRVDAANPNDTVLIYVTADGGSPESVATLADAVAVSLGQEIERLETPERGTSPVRVTLVRPATEPAGPFSPRPRFNLALGLMLGIAAGVGLALLRDSLDVSVKQPEMLAELSGSTNLASVWLNPDLAKKPLVALDRGSAQSEPYRTIRTNLRFVDIDDHVTSLVVTSSVPGEGKSTLAANLAIAYGQAGLRPCLVDGDLRRPRVSDLFGIDPSVGLTNVLAGQLSLAEALVPWRRGLLTILASGTLPPGPTEVLGSNAMGVLMDELRSEFDIVIIDAPPLLPVTDAAILTKLTSGAILVGKYGHVTRQQVTQACDVLAQIGAAVLGNVLTFVPPQGRELRYSYEYEGSKASKGDRSSDSGEGNDPMEILSRQVDGIPKHRHPGHE